MRYALIKDRKPDTPIRVHKTRDDESPMTLCGAFASFGARFSRRNVAAIRRYPDCGNCARVDR